MKRFFRSPSCMARALRQALLLLPMAATVALANPLKEVHSALLAQGRIQAGAAAAAANRLEGTQLQVSALNSLGRSAEALALLDASDAELPAEQRNAELRVKVLLALGRCDEAMPQLQAAIDRRDAASRQMLGAAYPPGGLLITAAEDLLAQTYCHAAHRRFDAAAASLARVIDPMDPSLWHYRAAWYAALRKLGAAPVASLDAASTQLPRKAGLHDLGLAVVSGRIEVKQALAELARRRAVPSDAQDAEAEILFFAAVAASSAEARAALLAQLEALSPFGSTEWVMSRLLFAKQ